MLSRSNLKSALGSFAVLLAAASPAFALAAAGDRDASRTPGTGPVGAAVLERPAQRLRETIRVEVREIRAERRAERRERLRRLYATLPGGVSRATLESIAACESGGDPGAISADGTYRGKYQFDHATWASVGGSGDPAAAPEDEQDYRAALLYAQAGSAPWPVCG